MIEKEIHTNTTSPILVMMSWRGGARLQRCLHSIAANKHNFSRIIISLTATPDSEDVKIAKAFQDQNPEVEVLCTNVELPTMEHQSFWVDYLTDSGTQPTDWIYWLAYDDELNTAGLAQVQDSNGSWPLSLDTVYFGPWAMRHETPTKLWSGNNEDDPPVWTSFPAEGPTRLPILTWIRDQIDQPTYMQMSGSLIPFRNYLELRRGRPKKSGPMRIEMATALGRKTLYVEELSAPISTIYGRSNSDRATYGNAARKEDIHLMAWIGRYAATHPNAVIDLLAISARQIKRQWLQKMGRQKPVEEEWRARK
jgi:hypothetical protein